MEKNTPNPQVLRVVDPVNVDVAVEITINLQSMHWRDAKFVIPEIAQQVAIGFDRKTGKLTITLFDELDIPMDEFGPRIEEALRELNFCRMFEKQLNL